MYGTESHYCVRKKYLFSTNTKKKYRSLKYYKQNFAWKLAVYGRTKYVISKKITLFALAFVVTNGCPYSALKRVYRIFFFASLSLRDVIQVYEILDSK